jgi:phage baseplate assembly protein V
LDVSGGFRETVGTTARRAYFAITRGTLTRADDSKKMQELSLDLHRDENRGKVEHWQPYGLISVPLPPSDGECAEALVAHIDGSRSHAVVIAVADRRSRPLNSQPGETGLYDDQGQRIHIKREGISIDAGPSKKPVTVTVGNAVVTVADGKITADVGGTKIIVSPGRVDLGGEGGSRVATEAGLSSKVFAVL